MAKTFIKELQENIEVMEDKLELNQLELAIILNEGVDLINPAVIAASASRIILQMLMEQNMHQKKHGITEKTKLHRERLTQLLDYNSQTHGVIDKLVSIKYHSKTIHDAYMKAYNENKKLKEQISKLELTLNGI